MVKLLTFLARQIGNPKLANKLYRTVKQGTPINLTKAEYRDFLPIRHEFMKLSKEAKPFQPGVLLRKEMFYQPKLGDKGGGSLSRGYFSSSKNVPMVDVDLPDPLSHAATQIVFKNKKDWATNFFDIMNRTKGGRKSAWKLYDTPAGIRMFDISKAHRGTKPYVYEGFSRDLGGDPSYIRYSKLRDRFDARLFPKPGRKGDFVAKPLNQMREKKVFIGKDAEVDPRSWKEVRTVHDQLIDIITRNSKEQKRISLGGLFDRIGHF